jgi:hypothetical protein
MSQSSHSFWWSEYYLVRSTDYKAPRYAVFSTPMFPCHS